MAENRMAVYNVRDYGASGNESRCVTAEIQRAIDACAASGGGMVYFPPGAYTTGTLHLKSRVRVFLEAGATVLASRDPADYDRRGVFYAEDAEAISLEGRGMVDGQAAYVRRLTDMRDWYIYPNEVQAQEAGLPLIRSFPAEGAIAHLVLFVRCTDVAIHDLSFVNSTSWTMHLWGCERLTIDGVSIRSSLRDGVWADGIDPDGCRDVRISNCTIETGDDALVFYSSDAHGPARACENITVTNCRLTSASSALKFCDGNLNAIRNVTISNCVITGSNRGIAFMVFDGGVLENVVISGVTIECRRYEWFWWGDGDPIHFNLIQRSEIDANIDRSTERPPGIIRNIVLRDIIARGTGACLVHGHRDSLLRNVSMDNVLIELADEPGAAPRRFENALTIENAEDVRLRDVRIAWAEPHSGQWRSALVLRNVSGLLLDSVLAPPAPNSAAPAVVREHVRETARPTA